MFKEVQEELLKQIWYRTSKPVVLDWDWVLVYTFHIPVLLQTGVRSVKWVP